MQHLLVCCVYSLLFPLHPHNLSRNRLQHCIRCSFKHLLALYKPNIPCLPSPSLPSITGACALYLHCAALLKDMLQRIIPLINNKARPNPISGSPDSLQQAANQNQIALERLQQVRVSCSTVLTLCSLRTLLQCSGLQNFLNFIDFEHEFFLPI